MFFVFLLVFICFDGFLVDSTNPPGPGQYMTDKHYKTLMDLFIEERQARVHLEDFVTQLQKEFVKTQTALGIKLHELNMENNTIEQHLELKNLRRSHGALDNKVHYFETEIKSLKQLKSVSDLQAVFKISNETEHLEHELQNTNSQIVALQSCDNARKQDFLALYNKTMVTEQTMNSQFMKTKTQIQKVAADVNQTGVKVTKAVNDITAFNQRSKLDIG
ncbi:unnamed protein product [Mytilus edulis]|uniref:Uncharacterized protein n=1 Tax=Mytilus edulis TaxID=6550 RepID=A0A8S3SLC1_MYTED|nr:unnamed protein product [Mytilus edulis]